MPLYEYFCPDCDEHFEKLVRLSEANVLPECPECGGHHTQKLLSAFAMSGGSSGVGALSSCGSSGRFS